MKKIVNHTILPALMIAVYLLAIVGAVTAIVAAQVNPRSEGLLVTSWYLGGAAALLGVIVLIIYWLEQRELRSANDRVK